MEYTIKKGDKFLCLENYVMDSGEIAFLKGEFYESHIDDNLMNELNWFEHFMTGDADFFYYFQKVNESPKQESQTPQHYKTKQGFDVIDFCEFYNLNFSRGNIVKYIARAGKKQNELEDLKKALDYLQREIKHLEND